MPHQRHYSPLIQEPPPASGSTTSTTPLVNNADGFKVKAATRAQTRELAELDDLAELSQPPIVKREGALQEKILEDQKELEEEEEAASSSCLSKLVLTEEHFSGVFLGWWDVINWFACIVVGYYEPLTFALFRHGHELWYMTYLNYVLNVVFTVDMGLTFFIATPLDAEASSKQLFETNIVNIAKRYCGIPFSHEGAGGWFWIDLVTVMPGWLWCFHSGSSNPLLVLRLLRLFRMLRLRRLGKRLQLWHIKIGFPFYVLEIVKFLVITSLTCHWMACIWCSVEGNVYAGGILNIYEKSSRASWLSALEDSHGKDICIPEAAHNPRCVYILALYWATMTLTSVGYGDITPQNEHEFFCCVLCMVMVGYVWAYIVGSIVNIISTNETASTEWRQTFDELNDLMGRRNLPRNLQLRLRHYMHMSKDFVHNRRQWHLLESNVSRGLQREVAMHSVEVKHLLEGVFWVKDIEDDAVLDMVRALEHKAFGPFEFMNLPATMIIMRKGVAGVKNRIITRGDVWGECDILLETPELIDGSMPHTIAYSEILMLKRASLLELCKSFPKADKRIRRAQIRTAISRAFVYAANCHKQMLADQARSQSFDEKQGSEDTPPRDGNGDGMEAMTKRTAKRRVTTIGSFAYPGKNRLQIAVLQHRDAENQVDLGEIKQLLLSMVANQAAFAEHVEERLDNLSSAENEIKYGSKREQKSWTEQAQALAVPHHARAKSFANRMLGGIGGHLGAGHSVTLGNLTRHPTGTWQQPSPRRPTSVTFS
jgi:hypothetical protein